MARPLLLTQAEMSTSQAGLAGVTFLLCAFALFMCASHSRKWRACYDFFDEFDDDPVIQHNSEAMIQTTGVHGYQSGNGDESMFSCEQQGAPLWQKNILMGGKCELPDFSGVIIYDSEGNIVTPAKTPRLTFETLFQDVINVKFLAATTFPSTSSQNCNLNMALENPG